MTAPARPSRRPGLSLIEVMLALTILLLSLGAIGQLVGIGSGHGNSARLNVTGTRLAQAKMAEVEAGVIPVADGGSGTFDAENEPNWSWTVESQAQGPPNLYQVTVKVTRDDRGVPFETTLAQMIFDPAMTGTAAQAERPTQADVDTAETNGGTGGMTQ